MIRSLKVNVIANLPLPVVRHHLTTPRKGTTPGDMPERIGQDSNLLP
jgi:hypothetical protein